jgi:methionyl-tRNA synthetase
MRIQLINDVVMDDVQAIVPESIDNWVIYFEDGREPTDVDPEFVKKVYGTYIPPSVSSYTEPKTDRELITSLRAQNEELYAEHINNILHPRELDEARKMIKELVEYIDNSGEPEYYPAIAYLSSHPSIPE